MFHIYSIPISNDIYVINDQDNILDDLLPLSIPWTVWSDIMEDYNRSNNILDYFTLGGSNQCITSQCYFTTNSPEILDWSKAYMNDNDTDMIFLKHSKIKKPGMDYISLESYHPWIKYRSQRRKNSNIK